MFHGEPSQHLEDFKANLKTLSGMVDVIEHEFADTPCPVLLDRLWSANATAGKAHANVADFTPDIQAPEAVVRKYQSLLHRLRTLLRRFKNDCIADD